MEEWSINDALKAWDWWEKNEKSMIGWTLGQKLAAYAAHVTAEKEAEIERLRVVLHRIHTYDLDGKDPLAIDAVRQWAGDALDGEKAHD